MNKCLKIRAGPDGLHFFNRVTGLNVLIDEVKPPSHLWSTAPRQVSIALTNACDLSCSYCYAPKNPATLNFDNLTGWLADLDTNGCIGIGFGGGEPTLYPRLVEICTFAARKTNLAVTMTTHAHRLNNSLLSELSGSLHFVRVSMDGVGSTYETLRGRSFDVLLERITALSSITSFGINYVVNSKTIEDLDTAVQLASSLGASEFLLLPEISVGQKSGIDQESTIALQKWAKKYCGSVRLVISEHGSDGFPICTPFKAELGLSAFAHIDASGTLKRASYDTNGIPIRENGVMAALTELKAIPMKAL